MGHGCLMPPRRSRAHLTDDRTFHSACRTPPVKQSESTLVSTNPGKHRHRKGNEIADNHWAGTEPDEVRFRFEGNTGCGSLIAWASQPHSHSASVLLNEVIAKGSAWATASAATQSSRWCSSLAMIMDSMGRMRPEFRGCSDVV